MNSNKAEVFLSYCWKNDPIADSIETHFKSFSNINIHRDKIDIRNWRSIKEYMQSIPQMDFTILLISQEYLKSLNCMYEILEVMRDRNYKDKIFPLVIDTSIYTPSGRAGYVKYWQDEYNKLNQSINGILTANLGRLGDDLKRIQDIASNVAIFLDTVADMNNPRIEEANIVIEELLKEYGIINSLDKTNTDVSKTEDIFKQLNITSNPIRTQITDYDKNQFVTTVYKEINIILQKLFAQFEITNNLYKIDCEVIDSRNTIYTLYKAGCLITSIKLFISNLRGQNLNIGISHDSYSLSNNSWNGMYSVKVIDGVVVLENMMCMGNHVTLNSSEEVVKDIWDTYIKTYLER